MLIMMVREIDVILGYDLKDSGINIINSIDLNLVYTNTDSMTLLVLKM